jgi:phospholipid transport system substrate-binding protein
MTDVVQPVSGMSKDATRILSPYLFMLVLVLFTANASAANSDKANPVEAFVQNSVDKGHAILNDSTASVGERGNRFRAHLLAVIDLKRISTFTLGPYARGASVAGIVSFENAFADYVTAVYKRHLDVDGQIIRVTGSVARATDDVVVTADVIRVKEPPLKIAFRVRKTDNGNDAVVDFQAEGVWLALTQRDEFTAYLQQHRGDLLQLAGELETRADRIRAGAAARSASGGVLAHQDSREAHP